jgi:hypothetical protein
LGRGEKEREKICYLIFRRPIELHKPGVRENELIGYALRGGY